MDSIKSSLSLDIYDLCLILQSVGFEIKNNDDNDEHKGTVGRTIIINCQVSGAKVFLQSKHTDCYCSNNKHSQDTEKWEMSGTSGGVQVTKMENSTRLTEKLPNTISTNILSKMTFLVDVLRARSYKLNSSPGDALPVNLRYTYEEQHEKKPAFNNFDGQPEFRYGELSKSSISLNSPPKETQEMKINISNSFRSLETFADLETEGILSELKPTKDTENVVLKSKTVLRQNTYTSSPSVIKVIKPSQLITPGRTSSPVPSKPKLLLNNLDSAEALVSQLSHLLSETKKIMEEERNIITSPCSVMDVSKISCSKPTNYQQSKLNATNKSSLPYSSSPNLRKSQDPRSFQGLKSMKSSSSMKLTSISNPVKLVEKSNSLKRTIPRRLSSLATMSPSFGSLGIKKSKEVTTLLGTQTTGMYKPIGEKTCKSPGIEKDSETARKKIGLYSHIKPKIGVYSSKK